MTKQEILAALQKENITDLDSLAEFAASEAEKYAKLDSSTKARSASAVVLIHDDASNNPASIYKVFTA